MKALTKKQQAVPNYEEMASALRVIFTWAAHDHEKGERRALDPKHVLDLCSKALCLEVA